MKSLLLSTFLLLSLVSFSQTRDEIISRHESGMKKVVITYSGIGNTEKVIKISEYSDGYLNPWSVITFGSKINGFGHNAWEKIKTETFKNAGAWEDKVIQH